jgi:hypothetical protein
MKQRLSRFLVCCIVPMVVLSVGLLAGCGESSARECGWYEDARTPKKAMDMFIDGVRSKDVDKICSISGGDGANSPTREQIKDSLDGIHDSWGKATGGSFDFTVSSKEGLDYFFDVTLAYRGATLKEASGNASKADAVFSVISEGRRELQKDMAEHGPDSVKVPKDFDGGPYVVAWDPSSFEHVVLE